jgi:hypothetical protein
MTQTSFNTRIWISDAESYEFPEQNANLPPTPNTGVCFSGGGTRALSAALGQLRGLTSLNLIGNIRYISCVSGGSWAATPYTYYTSGPANDAELLGPITSPQDINMAGLAILPQTCLGYTATQSLSGAIVAGKALGVADDQLWIFAVGVTYFFGFGLFPYPSDSYFSLNADTVADIQKRNPSLAGSTFFVVRTDAPRPYLVVNSSLVGPASLAPYSSESLVGFQYTPLYVGSPYGSQVTYFPESGPSVTRLIGGGFIEPFAMGSSGPVDAPSGGFANVGPPPAPFTLADASGTSSSAYVGVFETGTSDLSPQQPYWPVTSSGGEPTEVYAFGDGGLLENLGLISLLLRQVETIVVFINTETKLSSTYDPTKGPPSTTEFDNDTPPLFGYGSGPMANNQVFNQADFVTLVQNLQAAKAAGGAVMTTITHTVLANQWWGLAGGWYVKICWVYLDRVANWEGQLGDPDVQAAIIAGNQSTPSGPFRYFPNYLTVDQNPGDLPSLVYLTNEQVNLLADLTCWEVTDNANTFTSLLAPASPPV